MVDLIDGLVGRNLTEQGAPGRKSSGGAQSSVGFQSVLNDVATENPLDPSQPNARPSDLRPDIASGNELPDSDQNLPSASDVEGSQVNRVGGDVTRSQNHPTGRADSAVGFPSVLNEVATESPLDSSQSSSRPADLKPDIASGREWLDSDNNLPSASHGEGSQTNRVGEGVAGSQSSDVVASVAVAEDGGLIVQQQASIQPSLTGELGELIRLIESHSTLDASLSGTATRSVEPNSALDSTLPGVSTRLAGADSVLDLSLPLNALGTKAYGAALITGAGVESGVKPMTTSAQLVGDMAAAAQAKLTPSVINPDLVSSRVVAGAELDASLENETILELNRYLLNSQQVASPRPDAATTINQSATGAGPTMVSASLPTPSTTIDGIARGTPALTTADPEGFSASMATHVRVMKSGGVSEARLQLNPAELGRLSIQIASQDSEVKVSFVVESQQAKQVIENAMPRLRDLLDSAGLDLTESGVDQRDNHADDRNAQRGLQTTDSDDFSGDSSQIAMTVTVDPDRLVDAYA